MRQFLSFLVLFMACGLAAPAEMLQEGLLTVTYNRADATVAERSMEVLQEALVEFGDRMPPGEDPIHVHIAHTMQEFHDMVPGYAGMHVAGVARAWKGVIIVKAPQLRRPGEDYRGTLRHELVHVLLYRNVNTAYLPLWLEEGIAMSLANELQWQAPLQVARMFLGGRMIPYRDMETVFRTPRDQMQFTDGYAQALSMTRFLRNELGEDVFWEVVLATSEQNFPDALREHAGMAPMEMWDAYRRSLWGVALVGALVSGSLFTPAAFLLIFVYIVRRLRNRAVLKRWEREEAEAEGAELFSWEQLEEEEFDWGEEEADVEEDYRRW